MEAYPPDTASYDNTLIELGYSYCYYLKSKDSDFGDILWVDYHEFSALVKAYEAGKTGYDPNKYGISFSAVPYTAKALKYGKGEIVIGEYVFLDGKSSCTVKVTIPYEIKEKEHSYKEVVTPATLKKDGKVKAVCENCGKASKTTTIYAANDITLSKESFTYDGKEKKPSVVVKDKKGNKITRDYYTVTYSKGRKNVGEYTVTVTFKGNYSGTKTLKYTILPKATTVSKLTSESKSFKVTWKKVSANVSGYEIMYSPSKTFKSSNKTVTAKANSNALKTISGLKGGKTYYVRIRTYKTVGKTKIYSDWSKTYNVTTKK